LQSRFPGVVPFFVIASAGGSATKWLATVLNAHPRITCFHALRKDPFAPDAEDLEKQYFVNGLKSLNEATNGTKCFGSVHSWPDAGPRKKVIANGGIHRWIIREPLSRIHSLFCANYTNGLGHEASNEDIYETIKKNEQLSPLKDIPLLLRAPPLDFSDRR